MSAKLAVLSCECRLPALTARLSTFGYRLLVFFLLGAVPGFIEIIGGIFGRLIVCGDTFDVFFDFAKAVLFLDGKTRIAHAHPLQVTLSCGDGG